MISTFHFRDFIENWKSNDANRISKETTAENISELYENEIT